MVLSACEAANSSLVKKPQLAKRRAGRYMIHEVVGCEKNRSDTLIQSVHTLLISVCSTFGNLPESLSCVRVCVSFSCLSFSVHDNHTDPVCGATRLGNSL